MWRTPDSDAQAGGQLLPCQCCSAWTLVQCCASCCPVFAGRTSAWGLLTECRSLRCAEFALWSGRSREQTLFIYRCSREVLVASSVHYNNFGIMMLFNPGSFLARVDASAQRKRKTAPVFWQQLTNLLSPSSAYILIFLKENMDICSGKKIITMSSLNFDLIS